VTHASENLKITVVSFSDINNSTEEEFVNKVIISAEIFS
jgi:hypothetical protein